MLQNPAVPLLPDGTAAPCAAAAAHEQMEPIPICPPPPPEMKGGTGMTNPKLSTLLLVFRHEARLRLSAVPHNTVSHRCHGQGVGRLRPAHWDTTNSTVPQLPMSFLKTPFQRQDLQRAGDMPAAPYGWSSKHKTNLF